MSLILQDLMKRKGWSQTAAAREIGLSQGQISRLLSGKSRRMRPEAAKALADLVAKFEAPGTTALAGKVAEAAAVSEGFRKLIEAAFSLMHENA